MQCGSAMARPFDALRKTLAGLRLRACELAIVCVRVCDGFVAEFSKLRPILRAQLRKWTGASQRARMDSITRARFFGKLAWQRAKATRALLGVRSQLFALERAAPARVGAPAPAKLLRGCAAQAFRVQALCGQSKRAARRCPRQESCK